MGIQLLVRRVYRLEEERDTDNHLYYALGAKFCRPGVIKCSSSSEEQDG